MAFKLKYHICTCLSNLFGDMPEHINIDIGRALDSHGIRVHSSTTNSLSEWNRVVSAAWENTQTPPNDLPTDDMWHAYLWGHPPAADLNNKALLNACHASGLVLARYLALENQGKDVFTDTMSSLCGEYARLTLFDNPVSEYSLKQLRDTVQNLQICWVPDDLSYHPNMSTILEALFKRFGYLASVPGDAQTMNDQGSIEDFRANTRNSFVMTKTCIRRFLSSFCILFRHVWLAKHACPVTTDIGPIEPAPIKRFHCVAGADDFTELSMHYDLFPGKTNLDNN